MKTFTALHIARKLGRKTLVVTHTTALKDQWIKEVKLLYGIIPGEVGAGICNLDSPIVIGNIQSIVRVLPKLEKEFGTVIMDEAHHTPATTFTSTINALHARNRIALSGTMIRKDGKHVLFRDYFGDVVFKPAQNNTLNPTIKLLKTGIKLPQGKNWAQKINALLYDPEYQNTIAILAAKQASKGHKVLVIADRTEFLVEVNKLLAPKSVLVIGETKDREGEIAKIKTDNVDIICGSRQIFAEGISANALSCVILAVPIANQALLEQIIGRIMRLYEGKLPPEVIDIQFSGYSEKLQNSERISLYAQKGWNIEVL